MSSMSLALPSFPAALNTIIAGRTIMREDVEFEAMPQLTFFFDCPPEVVINRIRRREKPNRFDSQTAPFYERVRQCYLRRAQSDPERFVTIDAAAEPDTTHQVLRQTLTERGVY